MGLKKEDKVSDLYRQSQIQIGNKIFQLCGTAYPGYMGHSHTFKLPGYISRPDTVQGPQE